MLESLAARFLGVIGLSIVLCAPALADELEISVGHGAGGQLKAHKDFAQPIVLPASIFPGITGHADAEPAFHSTVLDVPAEDFFILSTSASVQFMLVSKDPGMEVWNDTGSAFLAVGGTYFIGQPTFDSHPLWNIPDSLETTQVSLTLKLHDLNGVYFDSDPISLSFIAIPEPGSVGTIAPAAFFLRRARR